MIHVAHEYLGHIFLVPAKTAQAPSGWGAIHHGPGRSSVGWVTWQTFLVCTIILYDIHKNIVNTYMVNFEIYV